MPQGRDTTTSVEELEQSRGAYASRGWNRSGGQVYVARRAKAAAIESIVEMFMSCAGGLSAMERRRGRAA